MIKMERQGRGARSLSRSLAIAKALLLGSASCFPDLPETFEGHACPCTADLRCVNNVCLRPSAGSAAGGSSNAGGSGTGGSGDGSELLADKEVAPSLLAIEGNLIFWGNDSDPNVPLRGCETLDCALGAQSYTPELKRVIGLTVHGGIVFYATSEQIISKCDPTDCVGTSETIVSGNGSLGQLTARAGTLYWPSTTGVYACKTVGCDNKPTAIVTASQINPTGVAVSASHVYWSTATEVRRCPLSGACGSGEVLASLALVRALAVDDENLYWVNDATGSTVRKCAPDDCANTTMPLALNQNQTKTLVSDGKDVYWTSSGAVRRCNVNGCDDAPFDVATSQNGPFGLALTSTHVYWTNRGNGDDGTVMRTAK